MDKIHWVNTIFSNSSTVWRNHSLILNLRFFLNAYFEKNTVSENFLVWKAVEFVVQLIITIFYIRSKKIFNYLLYGGIIIKIGWPYQWLWFFELVDSAMKNSALQHFSSSEPEIVWKFQIYWKWCSHINWPPNKFYSKLKNCNTKINTFSHRWWILQTVPWKEIMVATHWICLM